MPFYILFSSLFSEGSTWKGPGPFQLDPSKNLLAMFEGPWTLPKLKIGKWTLQFLVLVPLNFSNM